jgi:hemoglobin
MTMRCLPLIAASILATALLSPASAAAAQAAASKPKADKGLCDRLGGVFGISAVVDRFSDAIITNPLLNQNPALVEWNTNQAATRLPGLKVMRTMWMADKAGCNVKFTGLPLEQAHADLNLTQAEFAEVGAEIVRALQFYGVSQADISLLVSIYTSSMDDVVSASSGLKAVNAPPK